MALLVKIFSEFKYRYSSDGRRITDPRADMQEDINGFLASLSAKSVSINTSETNDNLTIVISYT